MNKKKKIPDYQRKIKTTQEVLEIIGPRPRANKVVMCHGTFDIVHPGHLRHLTYARAKADLLVVSLTCDAHISKANFRPYISEELRAMNLASFEIVDYVIIDRNATPIENIRLLQPDYFAKGYDYFSKDVAYTADGLHPKTREEKEALDAYGGELIFTPGDVVYSSSAIIEMDPPVIASEKLEVLMKSEGLTFDSLKEALAKAAGARIHVLGDTIVDTYSYCTMIGSNAKTPTHSVRLDRQVNFSGGASVVAKHLSAASAKVTFSTVLGEDPLKELVLADLAKAGVSCKAVIDRTRPTTQKNIFIANSYRMLKVDRVDNRPVSDRVLESLMASLRKAAGSDAVIFSDFRHGIFSRSTIPQLIEAIPKGSLRIADSQVASRWGNILDFKNFDLITPNEREARFALGDQDSVIRPLALEVYQRAECKYLFLKTGSRGMIAYRPGVENDPRRFFTIDGFAMKAVDPVGAGDAMLAYATLALHATGSAVVAGILGSVAAAIACDRDGNDPISREMVLERLAAIQRRIEFR